MSEFSNFPPQQLPYYKKGKKWRKAVVDWAEGRTFFKSSVVRNSVVKKKIDYDLLLGKIHMSDVVSIMNPEDVKAPWIADKLQHYPIINAKVNLLQGEEMARLFDFRVVVTNPMAVSESEEAKKEALIQSLMALFQSTANDEEEYNKQLEKLADYYQYTWQDMREVRANALLNHYIKEYNMKQMFNQGFYDAQAVGEEIYQCDIVGGEPVIQRLNPLTTHIYKSGYSNRIEDADIIILEDYWSPGRIIDTYYDVLTAEDMKYIEDIPNHLDNAPVDKTDTPDDRWGFISKWEIGDDLTSEEGFFFNPYDTGRFASLLPYDMEGNIRVIRMYWKSRRKIKKIKSYDPLTGQEQFDFYPEDIKADPTKGEEEEVFWINEAWEGTKIGADIYVNIRPRPVQYNRLTNPSRCHFGIVGSIYNLNENKPFSMVEMMKPYNYLYDVVHDRLNKLLAKNWGKILQLDLSKIPAEWDVDKWMYFARKNNLAVIDSFKEGNYGASTGKLAGAMNNASRGVIDADFGSNIQQYINLLDYIKQEMSDVCGISRQREGEIQNRETVGGVERSTLQSSHITEWLFVQHDDVKKRALECFLETAKIALQGRSKKFKYLLSDNSLAVMNIDGDEFAEADYGLVIDISGNAQALNQTLNSLAQAALQNQILDFSTIMKLYGSASLAEKQKMVENAERKMRERQEQQQQQQLEMQQQQIQAQQQIAQQQQEFQNIINQRDNDAKITVAKITAESRVQEDDPTKQEKIDESARQFNERLALDKEKLAFEKDKSAQELQIKRNKQ